MTKFTVHFRTDAQFATTEIVAETVELALAAAHEIIASESEKLYFHPHFFTLPINEIAICDEGDSEELAIWLDDDLRLAVAARDLHRAARLVLASWELGDLAEAMRELSAAVAKAEGGAT
jgi:hypothetical protein